MSSHSICWFSIVRCLFTSVMIFVFIFFFFGGGGSPLLILYQFLCMGGSVSFLISILFFQFSSWMGFLVAMIGQKPFKRGVS